MVHNLVFFYSNDLVKNKLCILQLACWQDHKFKVDRPSNFSIFFSVTIFQNMKHAIFNYTYFRVVLLILLPERNEKKTPTSHFFDLIYHIIFHILNPKTNLTVVKIYYNELHLEIRKRMPTQHWFPQCFRRSVCMMM